MKERPGSFEKTIDGQKSEKYLARMRTYSQTDEYKISKSTFNSDRIQKLNMK